MSTDVRARLCADVCRHLAEERDYLEEIRRCVLEWPAGLVASPQTDAITGRMTMLEFERHRLWKAREQLLAQLQTSFQMPTTRRFSGFEWGESEGKQLGDALRDIRNSIARLSGAMRASRRTLQFWSGAVAELLAGLSGQSPHAARYSANGRRVDAAQPAAPAALLRPWTMTSDVDAMMSGS